MLVALHQTGVWIEVLFIALLQLFVHGFCKVCCCGAFRSGRTYYRQCLDKHTHTRLQGCVGRATVGDGQIEVVFFTCQTAHHFSESCLHVAAYSDVVGGTEVHDAGTAERQGRIGRWLPIGLCRSRVAQHVGISYQCIETLLRLLKFCALHQLLFVEGKVVGCQLFCFRLLAVVGV